MKIRKSIKAAPPTRDLAAEIRQAIAGPVVGATLSSRAIVTLAARLRLVCAALDIQPEDVRLEDVLPEERDRLIREGEGDFWKIIHNEGTAP